MITACELFIMLITSQNQPKILALQSAMGNGRHLQCFDGSNHEGFNSLSWPNQRLWPFCTISKEQKLLKLKATIAF